MKDNTLKLIGVVIIILLGFIAYALFREKPLTYEECLRLGSNERTALCLESLEKNSLPSEKPSVEDISNIFLNTPVVERGTSSAKPYVTGIIRNHGQENVSEVYLKINFYSQVEKIESCNNAPPPEDTSYVIISKPIFAGDSLTFKENINTNFDTINRNYSYCVAVVSASRL